MTIVLLLFRRRFSTFLRQIHREQELGADLGKKYLTPFRSGTTDGQARGATGILPFP